MLLRLQSKRSGNYAHTCTDRERKKEKNRFVDWENENEQKDNGLKTKIFSHFTQHIFWCFRIFLAYCCGHCWFCVLLANQVIRSTCSYALVLSVCVCACSARLVMTGKGGNIFRCFIQNTWEMYKVLRSPHLQWLLLLFIFSHCMCRIFRLVKILAHVQQPKREYYIDTVVPLISEQTFFLYAHNV